MGGHQPPIRSLILLGGQSSRMGSPKYLLSVPSHVSGSGDEAPLLIHYLYIHHIFLVKYGDPLIRAVTLSIRDDSQRIQIDNLIAEYESALPTDLSISFVQDTSAEAGPAAGLVAAWKLDSNAHWLVMGCDYPLVTKATFEELRENHHRDRKAITCFTNSKGCDEPLLALWTSAALERLSHTTEEKDNVAPDIILELLEEEDRSSDTTNQEYQRGITRVTPTEKRWITSINTKEEWNRVQEFLNDNFTQSEP